MSQIPEGSQHPPQPTTSTLPTQISGENSSPQDTPSEQASVLSRVKSLNTAEKYWTWKAGLRVVICVLNIIGIGAAAWLIATAISLDRLYDYGFASTGGWQAGVLTVICVSFIWCLLAIVIPMLLKPARPLHPGIAVGIDLILWLAFILVGLLTIVTVYDTVFYGNDNTISDPSLGYSSNGYSGDYYLAPNNTWVYNVTYVSGSRDGSYYNYTSDEWVYPNANLSTSDVVRDCTPLFTSCEAQDQYVNRVWQQRPQRLATSVLLDAVLWLNVLLHFTVFVWACVDTHRVRARFNKTQEQIVADRIIADLERKGLVSVRDGVVQPARSGQPEMVVASSSREV